MDILGPNSGCFQEYHDTYSFRHQAKNRRSGYPRESANNANPSSSADMDANRNANANGTQGMDSSGWEDSYIHNSQSKLQNQCNHKYCSRDTPDNNDCLFSCNVRTGPFCHEMGQSIDASAMLINKMASLYGDQDLSDIQIVVGHSIYYVHKLVLCCSSDVLRVMLTKPEWPESHRSKIALKEEPECIAMFPAFLRYLYTGIIHLNHDTVMPILMLADKYNVSDLREVCTSYMRCHLVSVVHRNHAVSWLQYAQLCAHNKLAEACAEFICWNFFKVASGPDFLLIEKDNLMSFLEDPNLVVPDEFTLFKAVVRWLQSQEPKMLLAEFHNLVLEVLSAVRFPLMTPGQLRQLEFNTLVTTFQDFILEKVTQATRYHAYAHERWQHHLASISTETVGYQPRNYTNDVWGATLSINNFSFLPQHEVQPLVFASPISGSEADENKCWEWNADLFPKGVQFQRCIMIGLWRNLEVCGTVYNTVRLKLEAKTPEKRAVNVAVLVTGVQDNVEYTRKVVQRQCCFDKQTTLYNFNDIVPYEDLNSNCSPYLSGSDRNTFKITIVIKPV